MLRAALIPVKRYSSGKTTTTTMTHPSLYRSMLIIHNNNNRRSATILHSNNKIFAVPSTHRFYSTGATAATAQSTTPTIASPSTQSSTPSTLQQQQEQVVVVAPSTTSSTQSSTPSSTTAESLFPETSPDRVGMPPLPLQSHMRELDASLDALTETAFEDAEDFMDSVVHALSPARYLTEFLNMVHDMSGMPWWATIVASTFLVRFTLVKLNINTSVFSLTKMAHVTQEKKMMARVQSAQTTEERVEAAHALKEYKAKHGIEDWRMLSTFLQFPVFVIFLYTLRQMAQLDPTFTTGGFWWVSDLSQVDPYVILPVISAITQLMVFEVSNLKRFQPPGAVVSTPQRLFKYFMRTMAVGGIFFTKGFPAAMFMYWIPSNIFQLCFTYMTKTEWFKHRYGIPNPVVTNTQSELWNKKTEEATKKNAKKFLPKIMYGALFPEAAKTIKGQKAFSQAELRAKAQQQQSQQQQPNKQ